jgi:NADPH-dependent glutamate synthase beta subunit-like oxidoreductase
LVSKHIWEDNTKMDIKGQVCVYIHMCVRVCVEWTQLAEGGSNGRIL